MIHAYDKVYLEKARTALARMLDFSVYDLHYELTEFWDYFITSDVASRFEDGDFTVLVGKSGVELAYEVLENKGILIERVKPQYTVNRSEEYWVGWALTYYQWETALPFEEITRVISIEEIKTMYAPYHEMDIQHFVDRMTEIYKKVKNVTNLKNIRTQAGYSQSELAKLSDVPLRTIQQYEQRQKNINKAQTEHLLRLAGALCCQITDIMELV